MTTTQNRSSAVMQQRTEPHNSLDDFPTPPWATRALFEGPEGEWSLQTSTRSVREPCANRGYMVRPLKERFASVLASDVFDYGCGFAVQDYLFGPIPERTNWTVMNPPFRLAEQFIARSVQCSDITAVFVRTSFLEGQDRCNNLFLKHRPMNILHFAERVVIHKGKMLDPDVPIKHWDKNKNEWVMRKPSTATSYSWVVFGDYPAKKTLTDWIPPCRKRLERASDYEGYGG
jgi:hypothetical protein